MSLVQPLFEGPLDLVGDVHGEFDALLELLKHLGYDSRGRHPLGRRLVFLGDLVDRGPDSPAVARFVANLMAEGLAQCVLGNHELNLARNLEKQGNAWFRGQAEAMGPAGGIVPQRPAEEADRRLCRELFKSLPLALEREDLRVVHASWDDAAIRRARAAKNALLLYDLEKANVERSLEETPSSDPRKVSLAHQNGNAVKLLTSGPEGLAPTPFETLGKVRHLMRVPWWREYGGPLCVIGHYWRVSLDGEKNESLFDHVPVDELLPGGSVMCVDYSVGKRYLERLSGIPEEQYVTRLAALRWPERLVMTERGEQWPIRDKA